MKTKTTSEFANYIFDKFPQATLKNERRTVITVYKRGGFPILSALDLANGKTRVFIKGVSYSKMSAAEKHEAVAFIDNLKFDIVVDRDVTSNMVVTHNYMTGDFYEGETINIVGGNRIWRRIEKVTHVH